MSKVSQNLLVACNNLIKVESQLKQGSRVQLDVDVLEYIEGRLVKAISLMDESVPDIESCKYTFGVILVSLRELIDDESFLATNISVKNNIVDKLESCIIDFKLVVGRYLTYNEFDYNTRMNLILNDIIDTCINNGYYFDF